MLGAGQAVVRRSTVTDEVHDIGQVVAGALEHEPDIVDCSAFMPMFKADINVLQKAGLRDQVIVMVGGAPGTEENTDASDAAVECGGFHDVELLDHFTESR